MSNVTRTRDRKLYRLWALPLLVGGLFIVAKGANGSLLQHALLGMGMLFGGAFALRHDLLDLSPPGLGIRQIGTGWVAVLVASVLLVLAAVAATLTA